MEPESSEGRFWTGARSLAKMIFVVGFLSSTILWLGAVVYTLHWVRTTEGADFFCEEIAGRLGCGVTVKVSLLKEQVKEENQ